MVPGGPGIDQQRPGAPGGPPPLGPPSMGPPGGPRGPPPEQLPRGDETWDPRGPPQPFDAQPQAPFPPALGGMQAQRPGPWTPLGYPSA